MQPSNVVLVGFMGAGKTTVGRALTESGFEFIDLDELIVSRCGRSIPEIFSEQGEEGFREHESAALRSLSETRNAVVCTGGGVVGREENWTLMRGLGTVIYLRADWETLKSRLASGEGRPLADSRDWPRIEALWRQRLPLYEMADLTVEAAGRTPERIAGDILKFLRRT